MHANGSFRGRIYDDITQCIGYTPLVRLRRIANFTVHLRNDLSTR